ncbi:DUF92 domain-containing protein [Geobacillus thermoleovorans]|uniref:DUF92 domain-containing protein n=1 Tax=Geobacillus thermoleovorans TaxID=33941 RepID=A0A2Z3NCH2_GEOTH|nr:MULTISPECIES: DUF92 domain-containing protein [Geobacillus]AWO75419.1 DUF92 domain-containing protein [Geobacillus thermoleovorans]MED3667602.1 DUF92 domain-containing protein [Geobacillus kaustophilus]TLS32035.1 DUF92 domain-containing protein [Geobacillus thermoleovorans]
MSDEWWYIAVSALAAGGGWLLRSLSISGAAAAVVIGAAVGCGFSWGGIWVLGCFFVSSSFFSHIGKQRKAKLSEKLAKGGRRDAIQVLANGGVPAVLALLAAVRPDPIWDDLFVVAVAAANADTWASEIGSLSPWPPRVWPSFRPVEAGTSGAVTLLGTAASFAGALFIAAVGVFFLDVRPVFTLAFFGWLGSWFDTWLGAAWQAAYRCPACGATTERKWHCGQATIHMKGWRWLDNDAVNVLSVIFAVLAAFVLAR